MKLNAFLAHPRCSAQCHYEALPATEAGAKLGFSAPCFRKVHFKFVKDFRADFNLFFIEKNPGPKQRRTPDKTPQQIIALRKHYSITDIKNALKEEGKIVALDTVEQIYKAEVCRKESVSVGVRASEKYKAPQV